MDVDVGKQRDDIIGRQTAEGDRQRALEIAQDCVETQEPGAQPERLDGDRAHKGAEAMEGAALHTDHCRVSVSQQRDAQRRSIC